jgi:hypothetical protein
MNNIIGGKQSFGEFSFAEALGVGISKVATERLFAMVPFVGNGTFRSGIIKLGVSHAIPKLLLKNKMGKIIGTGIAVDGVEDIVVAALGMMGVGSSSTTSNYGVI